MPVSPACPEGLTVFTVDVLVQYLGNDQKALAVVTKIVRDAVSSAREPFARAVAALHDGRPADTARILHGLRGSIGTLGAKRFVGAALAMELAIAEQRTEQLPLLLAGVASEFALALDSADAWLSAHATPAA
ncbi:Hpt domain-containing protein [Janthinobacterium fluminis]|uniref:Hpt domain-containing protein n=1 Tax=Janthinobacterium fluminis TaxID=2987524 RepID=A0ABT5JVZ0_9BURK|nr:Hpt domain-containing protein [Janthinobacterium fluminis]MDC8756888.1 Hpt domain-containing protein [Janthinobacterium fluminis]